MKKIIIILSFIIVAGLLWHVWHPVVKLEAEESAATTEVPVQVGQITQATLRAYVTGYGNVDPEPPGERPAASARVASPVAGIVREVKCAEGRLVEKGEVLFQLDSRVAEVAYEKARHAVEYGQNNLDRQKQLIEYGGTSRKLLLDAEQALATAKNDLDAAQVQLALLRVQSPMTGTVTRILARPGEAVDTVNPLAEVVDFNHLVATLNIAEPELAALKINQLAEVVSERSATPIMAVLTYIGAQLDPKTGAATARVSLETGSGLRLGQFVQVRIVCAEHKDCLAVPEECVVKDAEGADVIAIVNQNKAALNPVKVGLRDGPLVEIEGTGLQAGLTVVTVGAYGLPKETRIHVLNE